MFGREVEGDAMVWLAQERLTGGLGSKHTGLAFDAEVALEAAVVGNEADDGLGEVNVEIVADDVPPGVAGSAAQQVVEKSRKIPFSAGFADHALDLAGGNIEGGDQGLSAVAAVLELTPLDLARHHRQPRCDALQGLDAGHLVCPTRISSWNHTSTAVPAASCARIFARRSGKFF